jgi:hypothetical protein
MPERKRQMPGDNNFNKKTVRKKNRIFAPDLRLIFMKRIALNALQEWKQRINRKFELNSWKPNIKGMKQVYKWIKPIYLALFVSIFLTSCRTQYVNTLVSCDYDEKKNQTDYLVFPYGTVSIPDKWEKTTYNSVSRQQFFANSDSITIAITFCPNDRYEFNRDNSKKGFDFVQAFYEWEVEYFTNTYGLREEQLEADRANRYIIWRIYGNYNGTSWDVYFLFGEKNGFASNFSIMTTDKWTIEQKIAFLKGLYLYRGE